MIIIIENCKNLQKGDKNLRRKNKKFKKIFLWIITISLIIIILYCLYQEYNKIELYTGKYQTEKTLSTESIQTVEEIEEESKKIADVLEEVNECVVGISKLKNTGSSIFLNNTETELGLGTGFIVTDTGYIVSNEHVTGSKYSTCYVTLENGNVYDGTVVWSDTNIDLSITKINAKNLSYLELGNSTESRVGETVYAIGNPIGYEFRRTVTSGIISAKNRTIKIEEDSNSYYMTDLIQTDATINPGNSGGPLIMPNGQVIGVNTVKITSAEGIGFAIPINLIKTIIASFKNSGSFEEATIGIYAYDKEVIPYLASNMKNVFTNGIYVADIIENGPADGSELKEGDIIESIDGLTLNTMNDLREYIYTKKPKDEVVLCILRGKIRSEIKIILGKK
jgi:S1-C subfamily serine protease